MINKTKKENQFYVIFRATNPILFRSTSIGYLYEIAQKYPVALLTEELDSETKKILSNKK